MIVLLSQLLQSLRRPQQNESPVQALQKTRFGSVKFLQEHIKQNLSFYYPGGLDKAFGGFYHSYEDDGTVFDRESKHLVSSTRLIYIYSMAAMYYKSAEYLKAAQIALDFVRSAHFNPQTKGYYWTLRKNEPVDAANYCYGFAFLVLAYAAAHRAGIQGAKALLEETFQTMEEKFWDPQYSLYKDEASADWSSESAYRGQNCNMHACEAMIAAYESTQDEKYLERAFVIAYQITMKLSEQVGGMICEHYNTQWQCDLEFNHDNPKHLFKPYGHNTGHFTEWSKLLLILYGYNPQAWLFQRAQELFDHTLKTAWDKKRGGIYYTFKPKTFEILDKDKYHWVMAESIMAAALLFKYSKQAKYLDWFNKIADYSMQHLIDPLHPCWFRLLDENNRKYDNKKSPPGKVDYHTTGCCLDLLTRVYGITEMA